MPNYLTTCKSCLVASISFSTETIETVLLSYCADIRTWLPNLLSYLNLRAPSLSLSLATSSIVIIDAFPNTTVEQGTSVALVCRVVGILSSATPNFSWTCPGRNCSTGTVRVQGNMVLVDVIDRATHGGMYTCSVDVGGNVRNQSVVLVVNSKLRSMVCTSVIACVDMMSFFEMWPA